MELKKKYKGIVYKRRESMVLSEAERYLLRREMPGVETQVLREIDWFLQYYKDIRPAMYIAYDRIAAYDMEEPELRVTFDWDIRFRSRELDLRKGAWGRRILEEGQLMEIKFQGHACMAFGTSGPASHLSHIVFQIRKGIPASNVRHTREGKREGGKYCA
ncbi:MAG: VTC domain-containing protein [Blautia marasmi]